jgi:hypothetical protein
MDTFLLQVNGTAGYPNIRDNRRYQNPSWATKGRDRDHGEVKSGDMLLVYCTGNAIDNGRCLAFSVDVRDVSEDHVTFHLDEPRWFRSPLHRSDIYSLVDDRQLPNIFRSCGLQGFNIARLDPDVAKQVLKYVEPDSPEPVPPISPPVPSVEPRPNGSPADRLTEVHLEEWLVEHWDQVNFGRPLKLYEEGSEPVGQQYDTKAVGRIDLLCEDTDSGALVVVELKKGRQSDATVGQLARYMGWVKEHLAKDRLVEGVVLTPSYDERLRYAVKAFPGVRVLRYETRFEIFPDN